MTEHTDSKSWFDLPGVGEEAIFMTCMTMSSSFATRALSSVFVLRRPPFLPRGRFAVLEKVHARP